MARGVSVQADSEQLAGCRDAALERGGAVTGGKGGASEGVSEEVQLGSGLRVEMGPGLWKARDKASG